MDETKKIFDAQVKIKDTRGSVAVQRNMPDISGALKWCNELRERIRRPIETFHKLTEHPILKSEQMERVRKKYQELMRMLNTFADAIYENWGVHVGTLSNNNLDKNLIYRNPKTKIINTNFDLQVNTN